MDEQNFFQIVTTETSINAPADWDEILRLLAKATTDVSGKLNSFEMAGFLMVGMGIYQIATRCQHTKE